MAPGSLDHLSSHSPDHLRLLWRSFPSNPNQTPARGNVGGFSYPAGATASFCKSLISNDILNSDQFPPCQAG